MTVDDSALAAPTASRPEARPSSWWRFGLANLAAITVLSVLSWWLLIDPEWSPLDIYAQPSTALIFWTLMVTIYMGFTFGWTGPTRLAQPWRGTVGILTATALGIGITLFFGYVWSGIDPSFSATRDGGAGFTTSALIVLFTFYFVVLSTVNGNGWPFQPPRFAQPRAGWANTLLTAIPSLAGFVIFMLPTLATWDTPTPVLMTTPTVIGWFYSAVIAVAVTGLLADNWPWRLLGGRALTTFAAVVGNLILGVGVFIALRALASTLLGPENTAALGTGLDSYAAQFGVCWILWIQAWVHLFGNAPTTRGPFVNTIVRIAVTFALAIVTFLAYYFVVAGTVLHEPAAAPTIHGDALGFLDVFILWILWFALFLGSPGIRRASPASAEVQRASAH
jgi:AAT family amino acid transporter